MPKVHCMEWCSQNPIPGRPPGLCSDSRLPCLWQALCGSQDEGDPDGKCQNMGHGAWRAKARAQEKLVRVEALAVTWH